MLYIVVYCSVADPDPHRSAFFWKPDLDPHQSEKLDPDPHSSQNSGALEPWTPKMEA
jgi:hypothetical protein